MDCHVPEGKITPGCGWEKNGTVIGSVFGMDELGLAAMNLVFLSTNDVFVVPMQECLKHMQRNKCMTREMVMSPLDGFLALSGPTICDFNQEMTGISRVLFLGWFLKIYLKMCQNYLISYTHLQLKTSFAFGGLLVFELNK